MRTWSADRELELACRVGSVKDFRRAIAEGANVNADGGSPLFLAIMKGNREMVWELLQAGASPAPFLRKTRLARLKTPEAILEALMEGAPPPVLDLAPPPAGDDDDDVPPVSSGSSVELKLDPD
jgi:ankyrin repeat protein